LNITPAEGDEDEPEFSDEQIKQMDKLHKETKTALQIALYTQSFDAGEYEAEEYIGDWRKVGKEEK